MGDTRNESNAEHRGNVLARLAALERHDESFSTQLKNVYGSREQSKIKQAVTDEKVKKMGEKVEAIDAKVDSIGKEVTKVLTVGGVIFFIAQAALMVFSKYG